MRIWVIGRTVPEVKTGMIGLFEFEQAQALQRFGEDVQVSYLFADNRSVKVLRQCGKDIRVKDGVPLYGKYLPVGGLPQFLFQPMKTRNLRAAMKACEEQGKPDVIHVHFPLLTLTDGIWETLKSYGVPIFITEHWTKVQTKQLEPFRVKLLKTVVEEAAAYICVGHPLRDSVVELTGTKRELPVIPNMVSPLFYPAEHPAQHERLRFLTVGRLVPVKRFSVVVDAFAKAFAGDETKHLTIAGGGALYDALQKQIRSLGIEQQVTMTGAVKHEQVAELMRETDCFVSASVLETFGVPFIEAWSCGKPVIGVKPSPIEAYLHEGNGILVPPDDSAALAEALKQMAARRAAFSGTAIAQEAETKFSQRAVANALLCRMQASIVKQG